MNWRVHFHNFLPAAQLYLRLLVVVAILNIKMRIRCEIVARCGESVTQGYNYISPPAHYSAAPPITSNTIISPSLHCITSAAAHWQWRVCSLVFRICPLCFVPLFVRILPLSPCQYQYRQYDHHRSSLNTSYVMTSPLVWPSSSLLLVSGITRIAATAWSLETAQLWQTGRCPLLSVLIWPGPGHDKIWRHPGHLGIVYSLHVHRGHWPLQGQWVQTKVSCSRRDTEGNQKLLSR